MRWVNRLLMGATFPLQPLFWLLCRLEAKRCPRCGERWMTELIGEWDGEDWKCHRCTLVWTIRR